MRFDTLTSTQADQLDFVPRERRGQVRRLITAFVAIGIVIFACAYFPALSPVAAYTPLIAVLLLAILCLYVTVRVQKDLDLVMAAEFQNMLYTQALAAGSAFSMIVRRDGTIMHASDGFDHIFPKFNYATSQALQGVFEQGTVRKADQERILGAIHSGANERLIFPVLTQYSEKKDYIITVEPLHRPAGFVLLRGREYLGKRAGLQSLPDALRSTSVDKLDHLLATTAIGHYTTDQYGRFEYVNPAFEQALGYPPHGIVEGKLSLHHIFFSFGAQTITEEYTVSDYAGAASVVTKGSGRRTVELQQAVIRDGNGKALGSTGTIV
jgi:PAS domain-containing protein